MSDGRGRRDQRRDGGIPGAELLSHLRLVVFSRSDDEVELHLGSLDEPSQFRPTYELWTVRREDWLPPFEGARRFAHNRDGRGRTEP